MPARSHSANRLRATERRRHLPTVPPQTTLLRRQTHHPPVEPIHRTRNSAGHPDRCRPSLCILSFVHRFAHNLRWVIRLTDLYRHVSSRSGAVNSNIPESDAVPEGGRKRAAGQFPDRLAIGGDRVMLTWNAAILHVDSDHSPRESLRFLALQQLPPDKVVWRELHGPSPPGLKGRCCLVAVFA